MNRFSAHIAMVLVFETATLTIMLSRPLSLGVIAALAGAYWLAGGGRRHGYLMGVVLALGTWSVVLSQGLFYEGTPRTALLIVIPGGLFPFGDPPGLYLYREGMLYGLVQSLRFSAIVLLGGGLLVRYSTDEMAGGLRALRIPGALCFLFSMCLRYFPLLLVEAKATWHAQHFRGFRLLPSLWPGRTRHMPPARVLLQPLVAAQVRKADEIAAALHSRGFSLGSGLLGRAAPARSGELALAGLAGLLLAALGAVLLWARLEPSGGAAPDWLQRLILMVAHHA